RNDGLQTARPRRRGADRGRLSSLAHRRRLAKRILRTYRKRNKLSFGKSVKLALCLITFKNCLALSNVSNMILLFTGAIFPLAGRVGPPTLHEDMEEVRQILRRSNVTPLSRNSFMDLST